MLMSKKKSNLMYSSQMAIGKSESFTYFKIFVKVWLHNSSYSGTKALCVNDSRKTENVIKKLSKIL